MSRYQSYPEYKDSGVEWLGEMPSEWSAVRLKLVANINMGQSPNSEDCNLDGHGVAFLQGNAEFGRVNPKEKQYCPIPRKVARAGELLFSVRAPVGALNIADKEYGIGRGLCSICSSSYINSSYLWWVLPSYKYQLDAIATGSTFEAVSAEQVENLYFKLPSIVEQSQISTFLEHEITKIDNLIKKQQQLIELLKEKRQAVISHAVTKGLNPDVPMKDSGVEWLDEIPEHWEIKRLKHFGKVIGGFAFKSSDFTEEGYPVIKISNVFHLCFEWGDSSFLPYSFSLLHKEYLAPKGSLIFAMTRPVIAGGIKVTLLDNESAPLVNQRVGFMFVEQEDISGYILISTQSSPFLAQFSNNMTITNQPNISSEGIESIYIPVPPRNELNEILSYIGRLTENYSDLIDKAFVQVSLLQERRTALISAAVTGKIDVRNWVAPTSDTEVNQEPQEATA